VRGLESILGLLVGGQSFEKKVTMSLDTSGYTHLKLTNHNGEVTIEGSEQRELMLTATKKVRAWSEQEAQRRLDQIEIAVSTAERPKLTISTDASRLHRRWHWSVDYQIRLSENMSVWVEGANGNITVSTVQGETKVNTKNGNICLSAIAGEARVKTINGNIKLADVGGPVNGKTVNGSVNLLGVRDPVTIKSVNGSIRARIRTFGKGDEGSLHTLNGSIELQLPEDVSVKVVASTRNGSIRCAIPMELVSQRKNYLEGTVGSGEGKIELGTTNGSIKISQSEG